MLKGFFNLISGKRNNTEKVEKPTEFVGTLRCNRQVVTYTDDNGEVKYGYQDGSGKTIIPYIYDKCYDFFDEVAWVKQKTKMSLINKNGKVLFSKYKYSDISDFYEGFCAVKDKNTNLWGYIDKNGEEIIQCQYLSAYRFSNGFAAVKKYIIEKGYKLMYWGFIDKRNKEIYPFVFSEIKSFDADGITSGMKNGNRVILKKTGNSKIEEIKK